MDTNNTKVHNPAQLQPTAKTNKTVSEAHVSKGALELQQDKTFYPGPQLTDKDVLEIETDLLRMPKGGHPDYVYRWLSMDQRARPNYHEAVARLGYTACTVQELPEMIDYIYTQMDPSLVGDKIVFREMILCKQHKLDAERIIKHNHHTKPLQQAREVYRNFWNKVKSAGQSAYIPKDSTGITVMREDDAADERSYRNTDVGVINNDPEATGMQTDGKSITLTRPKFDLK